MQNGERLSLEQIRAFLEASGEIEFDAANRGEVYDWVTGALCEQEYWKQSRGAKGMLRRYIGKMTGLSRAQVTRLISRYKQSGPGERAELPAKPVCEPLHAGGYRAAGPSGRSA